MRRSKATSIADRRPVSPLPVYRFIGGKGGVGKTTCAAALAVALARRRLDTLVVSTDPAHSLGDALRQRIGPDPRPVRGQPRLYALELDAATAFARWLEARRTTLEEIAFRGTWLDRDDVSRLLGLSLPGIDEIAALLEILELGASGRYSRIVIDTAPTGHLLRMLAMPALFGHLANVFDRLQDKHRIVVEALRGRAIPGAGDRLIEQIRGDAGALGALLRDPQRSSVSWVTLPETMAVEESADGIRWLIDHRLTLDVVIVNRITTAPPGPCRWCGSRRQAERSAVEALPAAVGAAVPTAFIPAVDGEPRGLAALSAIGRRLLTGKTAVRMARRQAVPRRQSAALPPGVAADAPSVLGAGTRLVFFGGKGGVGKSTCAAASAVDFASAAPRRRVLLVSADPAHSLGDVFGQRFSNVAARIAGGPPNLMVRELDSDRELAILRGSVTAAVDQLFERGGGRPRSGFSIEDREIVRDLFELVPPGIDELVAILEVIDAIDASRNGYDVVMVDTAPTGHALRLIETPAVVHDWVKTLMAILLKYQPIVGVGGIGPSLVRLSKGLGRLRELMRDPVQTRFLVVTRPAALPREETGRLIHQLALARISVPAVIVNAVGAGSCRRCRADAAGQAAEIEAIRRLPVSSPSARPAIVLAPARLPPPHGAGDLREWRAGWRVAANPDRPPLTRQGNRRRPGRR